MSVSTSSSSAALLAVLRSGTHHDSPLGPQKVAAQDDDGVVLSQGTLKRRQSDAASSADGIASEAVALKQPGSKHERRKRARQRKAERRRKELAALNRASFAQQMLAQSMFEEMSSPGEEETDATLHSHEEFVSEMLAGDDDLFLDQTHASISEPKSSELIVEMALPPLSQENVPNLQKYFSQRYRLFSRFDEGIQMDTEGWYSVTPEKIAKQIAEHCAGSYLVDGFCGVGGNAIQFATTCHRVLAIDIDPSRIRMARNNALVYGVADKIDFVCGDFLELLPHLQVDAIFLSPPWGGPSYLDQGNFSVDEHIQLTNGVNGRELLERCLAVTKNVAYFLPRNTSSAHVRTLVPAGVPCKLERSFLNQKEKAITLYFGDLAKKSNQRTPTG